VQAVRDTPLPGREQRAGSVASLAEQRLHLSSPAGGSCAHATSKPCPHGKRHRAPGWCRVAGAGTSLQWDAGGS